MLSAKVTQESSEIAVGVLADSKVMVPQKQKSIVSIAASSENLHLPQMRVLQAVLTKPVQANMIQRQDQTTSFDEHSLQILRPIPHSGGEVQVISSTTPTCVSRIPFSSPKKGAVISIPSGRIVTQACGSTKLKVGDTVVIPAKTLSTINPEKSSGAESILLKNSSGQVMFTPTKIMPSAMNSAVMSSPATIRAHLPQDHGLSTPESRSSPARVDAIAPTCWTPSPMRYKRPGDSSQQETPDNIKRSRRTPSGPEKGNKGLRHFAMLVCEKVKQKHTTTYNEVADELVSEYSSSQSHLNDQQYDQKNIRRRVYDALNVLMAMNIIYKDKKDIHWVGLPTNSVQELQSLQLEKNRRELRIKQKTAQLHELILQQIAFKSLVERNKHRQQMHGPPPANSAIQLPFIIVNTSKKTVIDCSISNDKYEYLFNFDNTFEIHDDIEVLKRMGMAYGLEKGVCTRENLNAAKRLVPPVLQSYLEDMSGSGEPSSSELPLPSLGQKISCRKSLGTDGISFGAGNDNSVQSPMKHDVYDQANALIIAERGDQVHGIRAIPEIKTEASLHHQTLSPLNLNT